MNSDQERFTRTRGRRGLPNAVASGYNCSQRRCPQRRSQLLPNNAYKTQTTETMLTETQTTTKSAELQRRSLLGLLGMKQPQLIQPLLLADQNLLTNGAHTAANGPNKPCPLGWHSLIANDHHTATTICTSYVC